MVVEDVQRLKSVLQVTDQKKENILEALETLQEKIPPRNVLQSTKIGLSLASASVVSQT